MDDEVKRFYTHFSIRLISPFDPLVLMMLLRDR